jgi:hypothetical protein
MTLERPMFPPRAEPSVIEFPKQPKPPTKRKSALVGIKRSGLDLVPSKKTPKDKIATHEECAKMKFRAWKKTETAMNALGAGWHDRGIAARFAYATMCMSRKGMIEFHAETDHEQVDQLLASFLDTAEFLKHVVRMIEAAQTRLIATACTALDQGVLGDGEQPVRFEGARTMPKVVRPNWHSEGRQP